ncbi:hypothetical protein BH09ACT11_BH09ACT11_03540 [soil metagenome]
MLAVGYFRDESGDLIIGPGASGIPLDLVEVLTLERATGRSGEVVAVALTHGSTARLLLLVGVGSAGADDFRRAGAALGRRVRDHDEVEVAVVALDPDRALEPFVAGLTLSSFTMSWRNVAEFTPVRRVVLTGLSEDHRAPLDRAVTIARASWQARWWATVPSNVKSPQWLADEAVSMAADRGLEVSVWDEVRLAQEGFGGVVAVGKGSATPPRLIRLEHNPGRRAKRTVVVVGKGITFDSGGYNLKPGAAMVTMKRDMTGAAVTMAVLGALKALDVTVRVIGLIPVAENAVSGSAMRPGDVIVHRGGRTTEVTNTDAEGRLVLADAIAYAVDTIKPDLLIDVATLTAAMKVALGQHVGGFFATDDALAQAVSRAGARSGEPVWRMPLAEAYEPRLSSPVADADNAPAGPGAITAALFLQHFTGGLPWIHLDLASVGDAPVEREEWTTGPTGFGARLLLDLLGGPDLAS